MVLQHAPTVTLEKDKAKAIYNKMYAQQISADDSQAFPESLADIKSLVTLRRLIHIGMGQAGINFHPGIIFYRKTLSTKKMMMDVGVVDGDETIQQLPTKQNGKEIEVMVSIAADPARAENFDFSVGAPLQPFLGTALGSGASTYWHDLIPLHQGKGGGRTSSSASSSSSDKKLTKAEAVSSRLSCCICAALVRHPNVGLDFTSPFRLLRHRRKRRS